MTGQTKIIDFHNHHIPARFELTATRTQPATQRARWEMLARKLPDENLLLRDVREGHLAARVVNVPGNLIADADGHVPHDTIMAVNDELAELVVRHPGRIYGLASVDGYDGDRSTREAERSITELGLRGLFVDCARGDRRAAGAPYPRSCGESRGASIRASRRSGAVDQADDAMRSHRDAVCARRREWGIPHRSGRRSGILAITWLARGRDRTCRRRIGDGCGPVAAEQTPQRQEVMRKHVLIDTTLIRPAVIRACVDALGADNVLAGSDFPIAGEAPIHGPLTRAMQQAGLSDAQQDAIAAGNCLRLLGVPGISARPNVYALAGGNP
jgi:aminocarboxymuconate-semialdehyde decarboxylase